MGSSYGFTMSSETTYTVSCGDPGQVGRFAVAVVVPDELIGAVMSDLSARRGRLLGTDKSGDDRTVVRARWQRRTCPPALPRA